MGTTIATGLAARVLRPAGPGRFDPAELDGLPEPVRRHLAMAVAPGTPLATSARLAMRGSIKVGRWLPFRARQVLDPHHGFVWAARAAGLITGTDRYLDGAGVIDWKLAGLVTVAHGEGPDVSRSAAGRAGAEAIWLPTALLPGPGSAGRRRPTTRSRPPSPWGRPRWSSSSAWTRWGASWPWPSTAGATPAAVPALAGTGSGARSPATPASAA